MKAIIPLLVENMERASPSNHQYLYAFCGYMQYPFMYGLSDNYSKILKQKKNIWHKKKMICQVFQSFNSAKIRQFTFTFCKIIPGSQPKTPPLCGITQNWVIPPPVLAPFAATPPRRHWRHLRFTDIEDVFMTPYRAHLYVDQIAQSCQNTVRRLF